jgi:hypothetical protein
VGLGDFYDWIILSFSIPVNSSILAAKNKPGNDSIYGKTFKAVPSNDNTDNFSFDDSTKMEQDLLGHNSFHD